MRKKKRLFSKHNAKKLQWLRNAEKFLLLCVILFLVFRFLLGFSVITGDSMQSALQDGEIVFYTRVLNSCERGQIVVFAEPDGDFVAKRIVAVAGDIVDIRDGILYVNGIAEDSGTVIGPTNPESQVIAYPLRIPENELFILGENRPGSMDSRWYGPVSTKNIAGTLRLRMGWLYFDLL